MIVVTGATGKLGRLVIEGLLLRVPAAEITAAVRDPGRAADFAERGVGVDAFCDSTEYHQKVKGVNFYSIHRTKPDKTYDIYISILEPELLRETPPTSLRVLVQLLNGFSYCKESFDEHVDIYVSPSATHLNHLVHEGIAREKLVEIPLSINPELYETKKRRPFSIAYASSPDRGLHHLLNWWPEIRQRVPEA